MSRGRSARETATLTAENIGGISETSIELTPGVTILSGRNATNRTSLLRALMAVLGSEKVRLKGDADEGRVELVFRGTTYTRRLYRRNGQVLTEGDPYLDDVVLANLFSFLLESNDARRAVANADDLREIIMRPVDTDAITAEINRLETERDELDEELEEISELERQLPELEEQRATVEAEIEERRDELDAVEADIEAIDTDIDTRREENAALESKLEEVRDVRGQLETVRRELDSERESIEALREERAELESAAEEEASVSDDRLDEIDNRVQRLRGQRREIEETVDELQTVIQFNEDLLDGSLDRFTDLHDDATENDATGGAVTDRLLEDDRGIVCWTCGSEVDTGRIGAMLEQLREIRNRKMEERNAIESEIDDLDDERTELEERQRRREQLRSRLGDIEEEIAERETRIDELENRRTELTEEVERLETEVEDSRQDDQGELLDLHKEANQLEVEIERLETNLENVEENISQIDERVAERDHLEARRREIQSEIEELRTRIDRLEENAVDEFNEHMEVILDILEYENLERIWIERTEREVRDGRRTVTKGQFELHIVRNTADGAVYEDTVQHLSESEREVTGLIFALAGYLAHEVYEELPFILLDSVEALDSARIAALVEYLEEFADYLVVALLTEDAAALDARYQRITDI